MIMVQYDIMHQMPAFLTKSTRVLVECVFRLGNENYYQYCRTSDVNDQCAAPQAALEQWITLEMF